MNYVRIALYVAFGLVALLLWNTWHHEFPNKPIPATTTHATTSKKLANTSSTQVPAQISKTLDQTTSSKQQAITSSTHTNKQKLINVSNGLLDLTINLYGGNITTAKLLKYNVSLKDKTPIALLNNNPKKLYAAHTGITNLPGHKNKALLFTSAKTNYQLQKGQKAITVNLTWKGKDGLEVIKSYTLKANHYAMDVSTKVVNNSKSSWTGRYYMQAKRRNYKGDNNDHLIGFHTFIGMAMSTPKQTFEKYSFSDMSESPIHKMVKGGWMALVQHYFITAWVPNASHQYLYYTQALSNQLYVMGLISESATVASGQSKTFSSKLYVGPEIASRLDKLAPHLSMTIDYGWLWFIAIIIFWLMQHIYDVVGNWGFAIIGVTILIKLVFYKLSATSYRSMAKMRALQPKLEAIKERLGDDKQAMSRETMLLYKKEGVNPLGGCLPILIQIPVFIALYWCLIASVELRQAPFILWIHDLSAPDPYYILPIIMGVSMFLQQRLNPKPADPMQAKIMMLLPVFFTFLFAKFPAGLVLYWTVNNIISMLQQWWITKRYEASVKTGSHKSKKSKA